MENPSSTKRLHILLFPFMAKGHTIPLLRLTKLIHKHRPHATFTIFTTPANKPFISTSICSLPTNIVTLVSLPFTAANDVPSGVESTDQLPSMSLFHNFAMATDQLQPHFEKTIENLQREHDNPISFLISDGFLHWTQQSASKFNIPRLTFFGMSIYASTICRVVGENGFFNGFRAKDEGFQVPDFPWIRVARDDFDTTFTDVNERQSPSFDFVMKCSISMSMSYESVVNSFLEVEQPFYDYSNSKYSPKSWCVGPFCLAEKPALGNSEKPNWIEWLDTKWAEGKPVLYVAFGSQADISDEQLKEMAIGLEKSGVNFLWALKVKPKQEEVIEGFEEKVKERGLVVRGWVDQRVILEHESVQGFMSHCGWNSVTESVCAGVPILAWPITAEQPLNAKMIAEEIKVGLRVETCDGFTKGFVKWESLSKMVKELMEGELGKMVRKKVKETSVAAKKAVEEGGSSWHNLEMLLNELEMASQTKNFNGLVSS